MRPDQRGHVQDYAEHLKPTSPSLWVICLECRASVAVDTRRAFLGFEATHRRLCGREAIIAPMFGNDDPMSLPPI